MDREYIEEAFIGWVLEQKVFLYIKEHGFIKTDRSDMRFYSVREVYNYWKIK